MLMHTSAGGLVKYTNCLSIMCILWYQGQETEKEKEKKKNIIGLAHKAQNFFSAQKRQLLKSIVANASNNQPPTKPRNVPLFDNAQSRGNHDTTLNLQDTVSQAFFFLN